MSASNQAAITVHLLDGTYELFRHHFGIPAEARAASTVAATRGVVESVLRLLAAGVTHLGVATDHVIESFRNERWPGYKTSAGVDPVILGQFGLLEDALAALGLTVWAMIELEADDALASAAAVGAADSGVERVVILSPDKDLAQCVVGSRVVQLDRRKGLVIDEAGVQAKFGVLPASIPDWLALVGDAADGYPGLPGWGARSAATVLARYEHLDAIPEDATDWDVQVRGAAKLASTLAAQRELAALFLDLARLRIEPQLLGRVTELEWKGPGPGFAALCERLGALHLVERAEALATGGSIGAA